MALQIESVTNLTTTHDNQNPAPKYVRDLHIVQETNDDTYQYYINAASYQASDKLAPASPNDFTALRFGTEKHSMTASAVKRLVVVNFPQIGAIGAYTYRYEERSRFVVPVHPKTQAKTSAPSLIIEVQQDGVQFYILPPTDYNYKAYRIVMRLGHDAYEYITYNTSLFVDTPVESGTYEIYCIGYINEGERWSEDSEHQWLTIVGNPANAVPSADLHATSVDIDNNGKINITMSDGTVIRSTKKIEGSKVVYISSISYTSDGIMTTFSNGMTTYTKLYIPVGVTIANIEIDDNYQIVAIDTADRRYSHMPIPPGDYEGDIQLLGQTVAVAEATSRLTVSHIAAAPGNHLLAVGFYRGEISSIPPDWTMLFNKADGLTMTYNGIEQNMFVAYKTSEEGSNVFQLVVSDLERIGISVMEFSGVGPRLPIIDQASYISSNPWNDTMINAASAGMYLAAAMHTTTSAQASDDVTKRTTWTKNSPGNFVETYGPSFGSTNDQRGQYARLSMVVDTKPATDGLVYTGANGNNLSTEDTFVVYFRYPAQRIQYKQVTGATVNAQGFVVLSMSDNTSVVSTKYVPLNPELPWGSPDRVTFMDSRKLRMILTSGHIVDSLNAYQGGGGPTTTDISDIENMLNVLNGQDVSTVEVREVTDDELEEIVGLLDTLNGEEV